MPAFQKSKKKPNGASKTGKITIEKNLRSNDQTNTPASPVSDPFKDRDQGAGTSTGYKSNQHEGTGGEGCSKSGRKKAQKDYGELGSGGSGSKSGRTLNVETAILELKATVTALESITRECIARHHVLERDAENDAGKLSILEELVTFLTFKMDARLEIVNHIRMLGHRPVVTAEDLYRAGLWPHDLSLGESGNNKQQHSPADLSKKGTDQEPSPSSQVSHPQKDDAVAPMSSRPSESSALTKAESVTKIPIATLLNDGPPNRCQRPSQPSQDYDIERIGAEIPTAENHKDFLADIRPLKKQALELCLNMAKYNDSSAVLAELEAKRSVSIASIERRVGLMFLVSRLQVDDQKAPDDILGDRIAKEASITCEGPHFKELIDAELIDSPNLRNENDTSITSLDNFTHSQDEKLTREGCSISGPHGGLLSDVRVEETSTITQNISQDQRLYKEGKKSCGSLKCLSEETAESQKAGPQQDGIEEIIKMLQLLVGEANGPEEFKDGSSRERAYANKAESFLHILANSWTEQDVTISGEMLEDSKKENAYLIEKMKILAAVDLQIEDSRLKVGVMQDAVESRLDQIGSPANGASTGKAYMEDAKPNQAPIKVDETKSSDSRGELRPQEEVEASSYDIWRQPVSIDEGVTKSGSLQHQASKYDASLSTLSPKPDPADMLSGLLATEDAAHILTSMRAQGQDKPRRPPLIDIIEGRQPAKDDIHDKGTSHLSSSEDILRTTQPGKHSGGVELQGEMFKIKPEVQFTRAVMEDFHSVIFLSPLKDPPHPVADTSDPTPPDFEPVAETSDPTPPDVEPVADTSDSDVPGGEEQVKTDRARKHYSKLQEDDSLSQLGANVTAEIPPGLNGSNRDSGLIANEKDDRWDKSCQLGDVANDKKAAESAVFKYITRLTAKSEQDEIVKEEESVVCANSQAEPLCPQSNTTEAATDESYGADTEWEVKGRGENATLYVPKEVDYDHYGCDHPFL